MADIVLKSLNNVHHLALCEPSIGKEMQDYFSFEVPGAKFHPAYRARQWDGKIYLYSVFTKEIYVGLKPYVELFAKQNEYTIDDQTQDVATDVTIEQIKEFCNELKLTTNGKPLEIHDYQIEAIYQAIKNNRKMLLSPTGSGKSLIIYCIVRWHAKHNRKQLILVPTTSLVEQLYSNFIDYSSENDWDVKSSCHKIYDYDGCEKETELPITISTWQSIYKLPKKYFEKFECIVGDEAHLFKAKSLTSILTKCTNAAYRIGTTGTLDGSQTHKLVLEGLFGTVYKVTTTKKLIDNRQLADLKIYCIILNHKDESKKLCKTLDYAKEMEFLVTSKERNTFIRNLSLQCEGNALVLFQYVEKHGKILYDMIQQKVAEGRKVFFVYGGTDTEQREEIRSITEKQNNAIIVASYGTFSTGINIRNLHNIIFASPSKSRIRNLQSIGRGLRVKDSEITNCRVYDIGDDLSWKSRKNFTLQHMIERVKIYNEENFSYRLIKVDL